MIAKNRRTDAGYGNRRHANGDDWLFVHQASGRTVELHHGAVIRTGRGFVRIQLDEEASGVVELEDEDVAGAASLQVGDPVMVVGPLDGRGRNRRGVYAWPDATPEPDGAASGQQRCCGEVYAIHPSGKCAWIRVDETGDEVYVGIDDYPYDDFQVGDYLSFRMRRNPKGWDAQDVKCESDHATAA